MSFAYLMEPVIEGEWPHCRVFVPEETFRNMRLFVKWGCCQIRVVEGTKGDDHDAERMESLVKDDDAQEFVQKQLQEQQK